jgi:SAM-dependent methyltransferase
MTSFYSKTLQRLSAAGVVSKSMRILVVCGGEVDRNVFAACGFRNVVITNIAGSNAGENVESLSFPDREFDFVVVHHGLHHCRRPHQALCEMYRVSRAGILVFEPCLNALVRLGRLLKVGQEYEVHAVAANALSSGGTNNEAIPNYVYRFTAEEMLSTIRAYAPEFKITAQVEYHMKIHWHDLRAKRNRRPLWVARLAYPFLRLLVLVRPSMANTMCVVIRTSQTLHPWLRPNDLGHVVPNDDWFQQFGRTE